MKNSGVTLVALIVMIIIIVILSSVFLVTGLDSLNESKEAQIQNEMLSLRQAVVTKYTGYVKNDGSIVLPGTLAKNNSNTNSVENCLNVIKSTLSSGDIENKFEKISIDINDDYDKYVMIVNADAKQQLGMENYLEDTSYIVDYRAGTVYGPVDANI